MVIKMNKYLNPKNYINFVANKLLYVISPIIKKWENKYIKKYANQPLKYQPVFIIGAPRTGSTILYQTVTNQLDVLYVDNLVCKFHKNFFFGFWLSDKLFKQKAHNCFKSNHGDTSSCGLHAPSECGGFWYRWLPRDRHFIDYCDITEEMVEQIREEITAVTNYFDKPLVFNNNNIALRLRLLKKVFPDAKYIIADREPFFVAQSLLFARKIFFGDYNTWWSMMPVNYHEVKKENYIRQVVLQHYFINQQMYEDLFSLINKNNYEVIDYSDFAKDKQLIIDKVKLLINSNKLRDEVIDNDIFESKKIKIDKELEKSLLKEIERLDWNDYTSKL